MAAARARVSVVSAAGLRSWRSFRYLRPNMAAAVQPAQHRPSKPDGQRDASQAQLIPRSSSSRQVQRPFVESWVPPSEAWALSRLGRGLDLVVRNERGDHYDVLVKAARGLDYVFLRKSVFPLVPQMLRRLGSLLGPAGTGALPHSVLCVERAERVVCGQGIRGLEMRTRVGD